ncbi:MAG: hypothetical protein VB089_03505 [Anaerolineaceae bacterium]|nr:hypothetical protein [Anaerolineaceae bacterium]
MLQLTLSGGDGISEDTLNDLLQQAAATYFKTRGTTTSAMRVAVEQLNAAFLDLNLKANREHSPAAGLLNLVVQRRELLFIAQCGPTHTTLLHQSGFDDFCDPESAGRGLGMSRSATLKYSQAQLQPGDVLVLCADPPKDWLAAPHSGATQLTMNNIRRRLVGQSTGDLAAAVVQFQAGNGQVHTLRARQGAADTQEEPLSGEREPQPPQPDAGPAAPAGSQAGAPEAPASPPVVPPVEARTSPPVTEAAAPPPPVPPLWEYRPAPPPLPVRDVDPPAFETAAPVEPPAPPEPNAPAENAGLPSRPGPSGGKVIKKGLARAWFAGKSAQQNLQRGSMSLAGRILPGSGDNPSMPLSSLLFVAIAIPLVVVAIAMTVYFNSGRSEQHEANLYQAQQYAEQAAGLSDPTLQRNAWTQALYWLDKAEQYGSSDASTALRSETQQKLDAMDGILRLNLQPALTGGGGFSDSTNITRISASASDVYLLDSAQGRVIRMFRTGQGYQVDSQFDCKPGPSGGLYISNLIDVQVLPANNPTGAAVMAMDATGNTLFCIVGDTPLSSTLATPDNNWGQITTFTIDQGILYVLDVLGNAVYYIPGGDNYNFAEPPRLFFDSDIPYLQDVIDLAVNGEDLYLLHQDGKMTTCVFRAYSLGETRCTDPAPYGDSRPGAEAETVSFPEARFVQLQTTQPPDPSVFVLDSSGQAIYHFSLRLNLQRQLRPAHNSDFPVPQNAATAFNISPGRDIFIAFKNDVFYAPLP